MNKTTSIFIVFTALLLGSGEIAHGNSIRFSKHDLSSSGGQAIKASGLDQVCIFCHTPHNSRVDVPYLWNRSAQTSTYIPYTSTTMKAPAGHVGANGQPTGSSKLCLSCHDGTIALGSILFSESSPIPFSGATTLGGRSTSLGTDLSDDHPISFDYQSSITGGNTELVAASSIAFTSISPVKLDYTGQLQCTACHDPHDDAFGKFLVKSNQGSALCTTCHTKSGWTTSTHATSTRTYSGSGVNPLPTASTTVAYNACGNCHRPHTAGRHQRLLKQINEEDNCLACHSGQVATQSNIATELTKFYRHPVADSLGVHDAHENFSTSVTKHVECEDCHNPHQADSSTAAAPLVPGRLKGVPGVDFYTNAYLSSATNEYQVCFKCHGDLSNNVMTTPPPITRYWTNTRDNRVKFNPSNASYHPVLAPLNKISNGMLNAPWAKGSMVYCTDCHGSEAGGAKGVHGSTYEHILVAKYDTSSVQPTVSTAYLTDNALCFKCHNSATLVGPSTKFPQHNRHLTAGNMERCTYCHDPHGNPTNSGMINFDMRPGIVTLSGGKTILLNYPLGNKMSCRLTCHGVVHGS
jgi:predicted CXXCH cytochrome family protein